MKTNTIVTFVMVVAGFYFLESNIVVGIFLICWSLLRFSGYSLNQVERGLASILKNSNKTVGTNVLLVISVNIAGVLNHEKVVQVLLNLKEKHLIDFKDKEAFVKHILQIYKKKYKNEIEYTDEKSKRTYVWEKIEFNIKNNILWENKKVNFSDAIYHEISIPFEYKGGDQDDYDIFSGVSNALKIRFLIVNGLLKVQVGRFDKDTSPNILKADGLAVYQDWLNIATFPLMYMTQLLPDSYLNFSMYATESYNHMGIEKDADWTKDWKEVSKERHLYNQIYNLGEDEELSADQISTIKVFNDKAQEIITRENFINKNPPDEGGWPMPGWMEDNSVRYSNECVDVKIYDLNEEKNKLAKYYSSDYHHDQP